MNKYEEALEHIDSKICELQCELKEPNELYPKDFGLDKDFSLLRTVLVVLDIIKEYGKIEITNNSTMPNNIHIELFMSETKKYEFDLLNEVLG